MAMMTAGDQIPPLEFERLVIAAFGALERVY